MKTKSLLFSLLISTPFFAQQTWQWGYEGGGPGNDLGYSISTTPGGFSYVTGRFNATANFGAQSVTSYGGPDIFIAKYTPGGTCLWARHVGSTDTQDVYGDEGDGIDVDAAGNCYVTGNFMGQGTFGSFTLGTSGGARNIFVMKIDPNGNVLWAQCPTGGSSNNYSRSISVDSAGNSWITGYLGGGTNTFGTHATSGPGGYVVKYDPNGNALFATKLCVNGALDLNGVTHDNAGNSYTTGYLQSSDIINSQTYTSTGMRDAVLIKTDAAGNFVWLKQSSCSDGQSAAFPHAACSDGLDGIYICGYISNGSFSSTPTRFVFGNDTLTAAMNAQELFLVKYDTSGSEIWARQSTNSSMQSDAFSVTCDASANVYITGVAYGNLSFGTNTISNPNGSNAFIAMFEPVNGSYQFGVISTGQNPGAFGYGISTDDLGGTYIAGFDKSPVVFGTYTTQFIGGEDMFIAKLMGGKQSGITENHTDAGVKFFETGNSGHLSIACESVLRNSPEFILYDISGRAVKTISIQNSETDIDLQEFAAGVYTWELRGAGEMYDSGKIWMK